MLLTRYAHSCVRLEDHRGVLVIDPGIWSEPAALTGADAVLVTHEHVDHVDVLRLRGLGAPVYAPAGASIPGLDFVRVRAGETFTAAGFTVRAVGGEHAVVYGPGPGCANLGYVVEDRVYHPGDALHVPRADVQTLCVPVQASWLRTSDAIDFIRAVAPRVAIAIHDGQVNDRGLTSLNGWLTEQSLTDSRWLPPRATLET